MTLGVHSVIVEPIWAESESSALGETDLANGGCLGVLASRIASSRLAFTNHGRMTV
jgi:hypothetical protein